MPRRKTDAANEDVAAPEALGGGPEIRPEGEVPPEGAADALPPAGAESQPAPRTEAAEPVEAVTVDEAAAADTLTCDAFSIHEKTAKTFPGLTCLG